MGPILLPDKSAIQALSASELNFLRRFYRLNVAPVLLLEILGDINKPSRDAMPKRAVVILARKIGGAATVNMHHLEMITCAVAGQTVTMRGVPILGNSRAVVYPDGKKGFIVEESLEESALLRWRNGEFYAAEELLGQRWREVTRSVDLQSIQRVLRETHRQVPKHGTIAELKAFVDDFIATADPVAILTWFVNDLPLDLLTRIRAPATFILSKAVSIHEFSPYLNYCLTVSLLFRFGLAQDLIGTKPTNRVDLEYLFYLPFCGVFSSRDQLHIDLVSPLLSPNQLFLHGDELKADLGRMVLWWEGMSEQQRREQDARGGVGPPEWPDSPTFQLWQTQMSPTYRRTGPRKLLDTMPATMVEKIMEHVTKRMDEAKPFTGTIDNDDDDVDFAAKLMTFRSNDPCFCGSDRNFGDCCGKTVSFD